MLVQSHREYKKDESRGCFAVGKSKEEIFKNLEEYCNIHTGETVFYYIHPVRPSKINLRPEYMMEIELISKERESCNLLMPFWTLAQY